MSTHDNLPPITDEVPENEKNAGPAHEFLVMRDGSVEETNREA